MMHLRPVPWREPTFVGDAGLGLDMMADIEASVQSRVARFLGLKEALLKLQRSSNLMVQQEARDLYARQQTLEVELKAALATIDKLKQQFSFGGSFKVAAFVARMESHISSVERLQAEAGMTTPPGVAGATWPWLLGFGAAGLAIMAWGVTRR